MPCRSAILHTGEGSVREGGEASWRGRFQGGILVVKQVAQEKDGVLRPACDDLGTEVLHDAPKVHLVGHTSRSRQTPPAAGLEPLDLFLEAKRAGPIPWLGSPQLRRDPSSGWSCLW